MINEKVVIKIKNLFRFIALIFLLSFYNCQNVESTNGIISQKKITISDSINSKTYISLEDKEIKFLWEEHIYALQEKYALNDSIIITRINEDFIQKISEPEKAALAYIATYADSGDCQNSEKCNDGIDCKITSALHIGCQCSNDHYAFLHKWFSSNDSVFIESRCYKRPLTASRRKIFSNINLIVKGNILSVYYDGSGMNAWESWSFKGKTVFQYKDQHLLVLNSQHTNFDIRKEGD